MKARNLDKVILGYIGGTPLYSSKDIKPTISDSVKITNKRKQAALNASDKLIDVYSRGIERNQLHTQKLNDFVGFKNKRALDRLQQRLDKQANATATNSLDKAGNNVRKILTNKKTLEANPLIISYLKTLRKF